MFNDMAPTPDATYGTTLRRRTENFGYYMTQVLDRLTLPFGWRIIVGHTGPHFYIQVSDPAPICNVTGKEMEPWKSRKWLLSAHMTDGEIVQTVFKATMTAMEHEVRELFKYRGQAIFDPHYDIEKLVELRSRPDALRERDPA